MSDTKKSGELPVTKNMLDETRSELKSDITSLKIETKSGFESVRSDIIALSSKVEEVLAAVHHVKAIVEEQENRNKYVLDGHTNLHDRQDRFESEINERVGRVESIISKMNN